MREARPSAVLLLATMLSLAGCVVDGTLDPGGGGRLRLTYRLVSVANFEPSKARLQSPDVVLAAASMTPEKQATFDITTADVRKLSTAPSLAGTTVSLVDEPDGLRTLAITTEALPKSLPDQYLTYLGREFRLTIELPGEVVRSNGTANGRKVTWVRPLQDFVGEGGNLRFTATFKPVPTAASG